MLVYPGLGDGQFGPAVNGGHGFFAGTNPTGIAVADLNGQPDLVVANTGSNDVSILLGQGSGSSWTLIPGPRIKTDAGPVAVAVGDLLGGGQPDLAVANSRPTTSRSSPASAAGSSTTSRKRPDLRGRPGAQRAVPGQLQRLGPGIGHAQRRLEQWHADHRDRLGQPA